METHPRRRYHLVRIALFACACVCVVAAALMFALSGSQQSRSEQVATQVMGTQPKADVLLILSYDDSHTATPLERAGVLDVMRRSSVDVDVEYMDALNAPMGSSSHDAWTQALGAKVSQHGPYSAIICADDEALSFAEANHDALFYNTPVVFFGVNDFEHARSATATGYATGMVEQNNIDRTMQLAHQLQPNATKFVAVVDDTPAGVGNRAQFASGLSSMGGMSAEFVNASKLTREELISRLGTAGDETIVMFLDASNDVQGNTYTANESAYVLSKATARPVFGATFAGVGQGLLGSDFVDYEADGQQAAKIAVDVMNGAQPSTIPLVTAGTGAYVFDGTVMDKYGISASQLPAEATVLKQESGSGAPPVLPIVLLAFGIIFIILFALMSFNRSTGAARTEARREDALEQKLYTNELTEKPNMQWLASKAAADDPRELRCIARVDIMNLDSVNSTYGMDAGDEVIRQLSARLDSLDKRFLVHSDGPGFVLGFDEELKTGSPVLDELERLVRQPYAIDDDSFDVESCLAIANRVEGMGLEDMVNAASLALKQAKSTGRGAETVFFESDMKRATDDMKEITACLKQAIADGGFVVYYQPQVDVETNDVTGYEALVRLKNDAYPPTQFIPVAEMSGLIIDIGRFVTEKAVTQLATWKKRNKRLRPVSINFSPVQLKDEGYVDFLLGLLEEHNVSHSLIKIEITENLFRGDASKADTLLERLGEADISVALDDFGIGYTSISRILSIPADVIKIDKSLVDTYMTGEKGDVIGNLAQLVHGLGKKVYVEGVETEEQMEKCRELGFDMVQGFYFSKPLLPERAAQFKLARA